MDLSHLLVDSDDYPPCPLFTDLNKDTEFTLTMCNDDLFAARVYGTLTHTGWVKMKDADEAALFLIKGGSPDQNLPVWHASFRAVARLIATFRNKNTPGDLCREDYIDWYCSSPENVIDGEVEVILNRNLWFNDPGY